MSIDNGEKFIFSTFSSDFVFDPIPKEVFNGSVTISDEFYGDVNEDGYRDALDLLILSKYVANMAVKVDSEYSDTNGDGKISVLDVLRFSKFLSGEEVTMGA